MTFIACGAFSGFKGLVSCEQPRMGFTDTIDAVAIDEIAYQLSADEINNIGNFQTYGFLPELVARFSRVVALQPLDRRTLKQILIDNAIPRFVNEFRNEGIVLKVDDSVLDHIVDRAIERRVGARGLEMEVTRVIERAAFDYFGRGMGELRVVMRDGQPHLVADIVTGHARSSSGSAD
jgi:ATP-dependent Clp protease ATP-binding subunit ClpX